MSNSSTQTPTKGSEMAKKVMKYSSDFGGFISLPVLAIGFVVDDNKRVAVWSILLAVSALIAFAGVWTLWQAKSPRIAKRRYVASLASLVVGMLVVGVSAFNLTSFVEPDLYRLSGVAEPRQSASPPPPYVSTSPTHTPPSSVPTTAAPRQRLPKPPDMSWLDPKTHVFDCNKWVAPGGSPPGNGSKDNPWRSVGYAVNKARAGDNVCVQEGTYKENHFVPGGSGTAEKPITFVSQGEILIVPDPDAPGAEKPVFDFDCSTLGEIAYWSFDRFPMDRQGHGGEGARFQCLGNGAGVHHIMFQHTEIRNGKAKAGVLMRGRVHDVALRDNRFQDNEVGGISFEGIDRGLGQPSVERVSAEGNEFSNNGGYAVQCAGIDGTSATSGIPTDIDIVNTKLVIDAANSAPAMENGISIGSCQRVRVVSHT